MITSSFFEFFEFEFMNKRGHKDIKKGCRLATFKKLYSEKLLLRIDFLNVDGSTTGVFDIINSDCSSTDRSLS